MIYSPSPDIEDRLRAERGGVWADRCRNDSSLWLVAKLRTNLIREIRVGAAVTLRCWVVEVESFRLAAFGFSVYDDPVAPETLFGCCRSDDETTDLGLVLARGLCPLQIHNENFLPLLQAEIEFDPKAASAVADLLTPVMYPKERGFELRAKANDAVDAILSGGSDSRVIASSEVPITLNQIRTIKVEIKGIGVVDLTDSDEGGELEKLTMQAFEAMFPHGAFRGPYYMKSGIEKEVCDVLAVSRNPEVETEGVFVIQSKVASVSATGLTRKTERRAKTIQNNIMDAIGQLKGAITTLKSGEPIFRKDGTPVEVDQAPIPLRPLEPLKLQERANQVGQAIVVISDMHPGVDWDRAVMVGLLEVWIATGFNCHVMDLQELGRLLTHSDGRPAMLEYFLLERGKHMIAQKSAYVRFNFIVETP